MAGELRIVDHSFDNAANVNFLPNTCVDVDTTNSSNVVTGVVQATNTSEVVGVCYDQSKLDPTGAVVKNSGIAVRTWGVARVVCSAAITPGQYVSVSNASGQVGPAAQTAGGTQPKAIVGRCLNATSASGDLALVLLMIGARY